MKKSERLEKENVELRERVRLLEATVQRLLTVPAPATVGPYPMPCPFPHPTVNPPIVPMWQPYWEIFPLVPPGGITTTFRTSGIADMVAIGNQLSVQ
jgi:hypothetical protein